MLKVLLIDEQHSYLKNGLRDLEPIVPPTGLMYIATYLKDELKKDVEVKIVHREADCISRKSLVNILREYEPNIVGIRSINIFAKQFHEAAKEIKQFKQNIIIVGGGPYVTMDLKEAIKDKNVDYFVIGEGEITFTEILKNLLLGKIPKDVKGLAYRHNDKIVINEPRPFIKDLDSLPNPDYKLISVEKYGRFISCAFNRRKQAVIFSSRGCPYRCIHCCRFLGEKLRIRSAHSVFAEIEELHNNFQISDFYFLDSCLDYHRMYGIFKIIKTEKMKVNLYLIHGLRGDIIDHAFIDKMVEAGVIWVGYAVETASQRLQKLIKKFINLEKLAENIRYTCEKGIMVSCSATVGFPTETEKEALQTIEYLKQFKKIVMPIYNTVRYFPNTEIYNLALKDGITVYNIRNAYGELFCGTKHSQTRFLSRTNFINLSIKYMKEVCLSKERLLNAINIQKKFYTKEELLDYYSIFFQKKINSLDTDVLSYAK